jgi:hypothetical protein
MPSEISKWAVWEAYRGSRPTRARLASTSTRSRSSSTSFAGPCGNTSGCAATRPSAPVPGRRRKTRAGPVRSLAVRRAPRRLGDGSRMTGDCHVRSESAGGCDSPRRLTPRRARWIASKGGFRKRPSHPSREARPSRRRHTHPLSPPSPRPSSSISELPGLCTLLTDAPDQTARRTARSRATRGSEAEQPVTQRNLRL